MPGYTASRSACKKTTNLRAKFYGKTALNGEISVNKYQNNINHMSKAVDMMFILLKSENYGYDFKVFSEPLLVSLPWMKTEHFMVSTLDFFGVFFHEKLFFQNLSW